MRNKKRKKFVSARLRRRRFTVFLIVLLLLGLGVVTVWKGFVVKKVTVEGNTVYSDKQIEKWVLNDKYSRNSLYVFLKNKLQKQGEHPFVDSMEISLKTPREIRIHVVEKAILGYVYIPETGQNAYFDKEGFVVEISPNVLDGIMKISGLSPKDVKLYEKLKLENPGVLQTLLSVTQILKKYENMPDALVVQARGVLLVYGNIQVDLGTGDYLNEKILRMQQIMPELKDMTGTLHLETWTKNSTDVFFRKNEVTEIPADAMTPTGTDEAKKEKKNAEKNEVSEQ